MRGFPIDAAFLEFGFLDGELFLLVQPAVAKRVGRLPLALLFILWRVSLQQAGLIEILIHVDLLEQVVVCAPEFGEVGRDLLRLTLDEGDVALIHEALKRRAALIGFRLFPLALLGEHVDAVAGTRAAFFTPHGHEGVHRGVHKYPGEFRIWSRPTYWEDIGVALVHPADFNAAHEGFELWFLNGNLLRRAVSNHRTHKCCNDGAAPVLLHLTGLTLFVRSRLVHDEFADRDKPRGLGQ